MAAPLTPFEIRGHVAPWTSREEEEAWIVDLLSSTDRWTVEEAGHSVQGAPMRLFKIGTGPRTILHIAQQHGSELSGREAWFTAIREWSDSTDPDLLDYLSRVTVLVMPTCHPDDLAVRENSNGVNINRDHIELTQPETQAIHSVIRDYDPDVIVDWHEGANITADYATSPAYNLNADPAILSLSQELSDLVKDAIESAGNSWELYQGPNNTMKGPESLVNNAAIRNRVSVLLETERDYGDETTAGRRHAHQLIALEAIWRWHRDSADRCRTIAQEADNRVSQRESPITLHTGASWAGPLLTPLPAGYVLTEEQLSATEFHRDVFGISGHQGDDGYLVTISQSAQSPIAYLMDPASPLAVVSGTPVKRRQIVALSMADVMGYRVRHGGTVYSVTRARYRKAGQVHDVTLPAPGQQRGRS